MPAISSTIDFHAISGKLNEYSRIEQIGGVIAGIFGLYCLHAVPPASQFYDDHTDTVGAICFRVESDQAYPRSILGKDNFHSMVVQCHEGTQGRMDQGDSTQIW
jgi:hypothetical protein